MSTLRERTSAAQRIIRAAGPLCEYPHVRQAMKAEGLNPVCQATFNSYRDLMFPDWRKAATAAKQDRIVNGRPGPPPKEDPPMPAAPPADGRASPRPPAVLPDRPPAPEAPRVKPPDPGPQDYLGRLVRFGMAVEAVGGIASAERMLTALKQLQEARP